MARREFGSALAASVLGFATALASWPAAALDVQRSERELGGQLSRLQRAEDAPRTSLRPQAVPGGLQRSAPQSRLGPAQGPETVLREAEVPPERLERTRELLQEFKAEATPEKAISIDLPADVLFDFDKYELRTDAAPSLDKAAELIQSYPNAPLLVRGHTDSKGSDAYNERLSERRADAVARELQTRTGREPATEGLGKREPIAPNETGDGKDNPQGRQLNRRVQILIEPGKAN